MWKIGKHALGVEVPNWRARHHVESHGSKNAEVNGGVGLFHITVLHIAGFHSAGDCPSAQEALHDEFAGEGQHDDVESHEEEVASAFAIVCWTIGVCARVGRDEWMRGGKGIGEEDETMKRVARGGIDSVEGECEDDDDQRIGPCVLESEVLPAANVRAGFSAFGMGTGNFGLGAPLSRLSVPRTGEEVKDSYRRQ